MVIIPVGELPQDVQLQIEALVKEFSEKIDSLIEGGTHVLVPIIASKIINEKYVQVMTGIAHPMGVPSYQGGQA